MGEILKPPFGLNFQEKLLCTPSRCIQTLVVNALSQLQCAGRGRNALFKIFRVTGYYF